MKKVIFIGLLISSTVFAGNYGEFRCKMQGNPCAYAQQLGYCVSIGLNVRAEVDQHGNSGVFDGNFGELKIKTFSPHNPNMGLASYSVPMTHSVLTKYITSVAGAVKGADANMDRYNVKPSKPGFNLWSGKLYLKFKNDDVVFSFICGK